MPTYDATGAGQSFYATTGSINHESTEGASVYAFVSVSNALGEQPLSGVTYGGQSMNQMGTPVYFNGQTVGFVAVYELDDVPGDQQQIAVTASKKEYFTVCSVSYTDVTAAKQYAKIIGNSAWTTVGLPLDEGLVGVLGCGAYKTLFQGPINAEGRFNGAYAGNHFGSLLVADTTNLDPDDPSPVGGQLTASDRWAINGIKLS